jgi:transposase
LSGQAVKTVRMEIIQPREEAGDISLFGDRFVVEKKVADGKRARGRPRLKPINRQQLLMRSIDVEKLIEADHPARAIWEMLGQVDMSRFEQEIRAVEGHAGQAAVSPRLLAALWIYSYAEGISSARELSRMCDYEPACQWLTGMETINHHTLSDFRVEHKDGLDGLFIQILGLLSAEGLVELKQVTQDGTKIKANAGKDTFRGEQRVKQHLELAREQIQAMEDPRSEVSTQRMARAQERALREKKQRLEFALEELKRVQDDKPEKEKPEARVSLTDPEARVMKTHDGGWAPSYNVQVCTDTAHGIIVDVAASQAGNDRDQMSPAIKRLQQRVGLPEQLITDAGYTSHGNIEMASEENVELIAAVANASPGSRQYERRGIASEFHTEAFRYEADKNQYVCPAGKILKFTGKERHVGRIKSRYQAAPSECQRCRFRDQCCPKTKSRRITRSEDSPTVRAFLLKMQTTEAKQIYRKRGPVAEFVNAWLKEKLGLRQFRLRGLAKVQIECLWVSVTYNIQQWIRLRWRSQFATA